MEQSQRGALPLSPKVKNRALKTTLKSSDMSGAASEVLLNLPNVSTTSPPPDAATISAEAKTDPNKEQNTNTKTPTQTDSTTSGSTTPVPSPPPAKDNSRELDESSDVVSDVVPSAEKRGTISSRRASNTIARRRFLKAKTAVAFGVRLSNLSRTSMLRARAPKEFSVIERVQRLEEKVAEMKKESEAAKLEVDERMVQLEESKTEDWISDAVKALASRMQKLETSALTIPKSAEPAEHTILVLKKMQLTLSTHIEKTESLAEESFANRLVSLQQRMVETASSYQNMTSEVSKIKLPDIDYDMTAF